MFFLGDDEVYFVDHRSHQGDTALIRAAGYDMKEVVIELLHMGSDLEATNKYGHNALIWACMCGNAEVVRILLEKKANISHQALDGRTCLHYACEYGKSRVVGCIFDVLFERFSSYRAITHPFTKYDSQRWIKYADMMTDIVMVSV
jgi:ankyrin repeat protein